MSDFFTVHENRIECRLCPHFCRIAEGRTGICGVRKNNGREIELITYGIVSGYSLDPVEKKPLYHYYPGHNVLSIGSFGCNMRCDFCQNWHISQTGPGSSHRNMSPEDLAKAAITAHRNIGIAFTYNEPMVWYEYIRDVSEAVHAAGMKTVIVSNGYVSREPLEEIISFTDAFNIDLKAFNDVSYRKLTGASLEPVKDTLKHIALAGKHLEITSLIIPGHNDSPEQMEVQSKWIASELGRNIPLHLSRYYPTYKRNDPATSPLLLEKLFETASENLDHVYLGNLHTGEGQNTKCNGCGSIVTTRTSYHVNNTGADNDGKCKNCGRTVYSDFIFSRE